MEDVSDLIVTEVETGEFTEISGCKRIRLNLSDLIVY